MFLFRKKEKEEQNITQNYSVFTDENEGITAMVVSDVMSIVGRGAVVIGKVCRRLTIGQVLSNTRTGEKFDIAGIETFGKVMDSIDPCERCGLLLRNATSKNISKGDILVIC